MNDASKSAVMDADDHTENRQMSVGRECSNVALSITQDSKLSAP